MPGSIICVLGMHRSGTSYLTGSLQNAGLSLGDCHTWNPHNKKGNRENQAFIDLNDLVLSANGGAWDNPPDKVIWQDSHLQVAEELLKSNSSTQRFGFKDPRTLLTLDGWKRVSSEMDFVGIFRHPNSVAESLHRRGQMPRDEALNLWLAYNSRLYRGYKKSNFPIICFDDPEEILHQRLDQALEILGLVPVAEDDRFYEDGLRNSQNTASSQKLPWRVARLYNKLKKISL